VKKNFPAAGDLVVRLEQDPEIDGQWIVIDVAAAGPVDDVLAVYDQCTADWVAFLPPEALNLLCLTYRLV
jgi:hypothetical protein